MSSDTLLHEPHHASRRNLWFGFSAVAVAWAVYGATWLLISAQACKNGNGYLGPLSPEDVRWLLAGIALVLFAIAVYAGLLSFHEWRHISAQRDLVHVEAEQVEQYLALGGVFISMIFSLGIIWGALPLIMVGVCVKAR